MKDFIGVLTESANYEVTFVGIRDKFHTVASSERHALRNVLYRLSKTQKYSGTRLGDVNWSNPNDAYRVLEKNPQIWKAVKLPDNLKQDMPELPIQRIAKDVDPQKYFDF